MQMYSDRRKETSKINYLSFQLKKLEKKEQMKQKEENREKKKQKIDLQSDNSMKPKAHS